MIEIGIKGHQQMLVTESDIATEVGSGKVRVFATPMMIALIEKTASLSVEPYLEEGQTTVGTLVDVTHTAATPIGMEVHAESEVMEVDRRRIVFAVKAYDECGPIGEGRHERFVTDIRKFEEKCASKLRSVR